MWLKYLRSYYLTKFQARFQLGGFGRLAKAPIGITDTIKSVSGRGVSRLDIMGIWRLSTTKLTNIYRAGF